MTTPETPSAAAAADVLAELELLDKSQPFRDLLYIGRNTLQRVIATLREPAGEGVACPTCGETEPRTGNCGTSDNDTRALCKRTAAPTGAVAEVERLRAEIAGYAARFAALTDAMALLERRATPREQTGAVGGDGAWCIDLTSEQGGALWALISDDDGEAAPFSLYFGDGHSGRGLYAILSEYPDEGAVLIAGGIHLSQAFVTSVTAAHAPDVSVIGTDQSPVPESQADTLRRYVDRFLAWPLPASVCADLIAARPTTEHRTGTNLLTADEATAMFAHVLAPQPHASATGGVELAQETRKALDALFIFLGMEDHARVAEQGVEVYIGISKMEEALRTHAERGGRGNGAPHDSAIAQAFREAIDCDLQDWPAYPETFRDYVLDRARKIVALQGATR